jgi:hypothetical protein
MPDLVEVIFVAGIPTQVLDAVVHNTAVGKMADLCSVRSRA